MSLSEIACLRQWLPSRVPASPFRSFVFASHTIFAVPRYMPSFRNTFGVLAIACVLVGCTRKKQENADLRTRISSAKNSSYCRSAACFSPHILIIESGYFVTVFTGDRPRSTAVSTEALGEYLTALPMSAWPLGPIVVITPSDDVFDSRAIQKNLDQAQRTCRSLGLEVQLHPGG